MTPSSQQKDEPLTIQLALAKIRTLVASPATMSERLVTELAPILGALNDPQSLSSKTSWSFLGKEKIQTTILKMAGLLFTKHSKYIMRLPKRA